MIYHCFIINKNLIWHRDLPLLISNMSLDSEAEIDINSDKRLDPFRGGSFWSRWSTNQELVKSRIKFLEEFNIKKRRFNGEHKTPYGLKGRFEKEVRPNNESGYPCDLDHFEFYERKDKLGFVAIFSPYSDKLYEWLEDHKIALDLGYVKYHSNLYDTQGSTYYKLIPHKK